MFSRLIGLAGMIGCLAMIYLFETSSSASGWIRILHWPAMLLTGIGPITICLLCYGFRPLFRMLLIIAFRSPNGLKKRVEREAVYLFKLGRDFYENGPSAFETAKTKGLSPLIKNVIDRLSIRMPYNDIHELTRIEKDQRESELNHLLAVVGAAVRLTPSIGMLGTIMGMVQLLANLSDPSHIGPHMSLALLTTFYGLFFSIAIWTPAQQKMEKILSLEMEELDQSMRWLSWTEKRKPGDYFVDTANLPKHVAKGLRRP